MADSSQQVHVFYTGRVQGVGFRYTAQQTAQRFNVRGWVRNLRDGQVELVAIGPQDTLTEFLDAVRQGPLNHYIESASVTWEEAAQDYRGFDIRATADNS